LNFFGDTVNYVVTQQFGFLHLTELGRKGCLSGTDKCCRKY